MAWVPLNESGVYYGLAADSPDAGELIGSTVVAGTSDTSREWTLHFGVPELPTGRVRITTTSYESSGDGIASFYWTYGDSEDVQSNESDYSSFDFQPSPLVMDVFPDGELYYVRFDWNGTGTTLDAEFFVEVEMDEGGGEGGGEGNCFWEDLVNTEQVCGGGGGGGGGLELSYVRTPGGFYNCGGSDGWFFLDEDAFDAMTTATNVTITGVAQSAWTTDTHASEEPEITNALLAEVEFSEVSLAMTYNGGASGWKTEFPSGPDADYMQWIRIDVDGTLYYAFVSMTTFC